MGHGVQAESLFLTPDSFPVMEIRYSPREYAMTRIQTQVLMIAERTTPPLSYGALLRWVGVGGRHTLMVSRGNFMGVARVRQYLAYIACVSTRNQT